MKVPRLLPACLPVISSLRGHRFCCLALARSMGILLSLRPTVTRPRCTISFCNACQPVSLCTTPHCLRLSTAPCWLALPYLSPSFHLPRLTCNLLQLDVLQSDDRKLPTRQRS